MTKKTEIIVGLLFVLISVTAFYVTLGDNVRVRVDDDKARFYVSDNGRWITSGTEYVILFDGSKRMNRDARNIRKYIDINRHTRQVTITRETPYIRGPIIIEEWLFDGSSMNVEVFPVYHKITVQGAKGKILQYEVRDLVYDGPTVKNVMSPQSFGRNMKVEFQNGWYWNTLYQSDIFKVRYRMKTDKDTVMVRLFDPTPLLDPGGSCSIGGNRSACLKTVSDNWNANNASFSITVDGRCVQAVPWFDTADSNLMENNGCCDDLHSCINTPLNGYSNESFCQVTDEWSRAFAAQALLSQNGTLMECYVNMYGFMNDTGNTYSGSRSAKGYLAEWVVEIYYNGTHWTVDRRQVGDTAADADAYGVIGLGIVNTSSYANTSVREKAGDYMDGACPAFLEQNFKDVSASNLQYGFKSGSFKYFPCGGSNVCSALSSTDFMYQAYYGPMMEAAAACHAKLGSNSTHNYSRAAQDTYYNMLRAAEWTGGSFKVPPGRAYTWTNTGSGQTPAASCTNSCTSGGQTLGNEWPDSARDVDVCRAVYIVNNLTGIPLTNLTYCQQWESKACVGVDSYGYQFDINGVNRGTCDDKNFRAVGLGASTKFLYDSADLVGFFDEYVNDYSGGVMNSQNALGVYDKSFGLHTFSIAMGLGDPAWTQNASGPANETGNETNGTVLNVTITNPGINDTTINVGASVNISVEANTSSSHTIDTVKVQVLYPNGTQMNFTMEQLIMNQTVNFTAGEWILEHNATWDDDAELWTGGTHDNVSKTYNKTGSFGKINRDYEFGNKELYNLTWDFWFFSGSGVDVKFKFSDDGAGGSNDYLLMDCTTPPTCSLKHVQDGSGFQQCNQTATSPFTWTNGDTLKIAVNRSSGEWRTYYNGDLCYIASSTLAADGNFNIDQGNGAIAIDNVLYHRFVPGSGAQTCTNQTTNATGDSNLIINYSSTASWSGNWSGHSATGNDSYGGFINFTNGQTASVAGGLEFLEQSIYNYTVNITFNHTLSNYTKFYFKAPAGSTGGPRWMLENDGANLYRVKHDGGAFCTIATVNTSLQVYTLQIFVDVAANTSDGTLFNSTGESVGSPCTAQAFASGQGNSSAIEAGQFGIGAHLKVYDWIIWNGTGPAGDAGQGNTTENCTNATSSVTNTTTYWVSFNDTANEGQYNTSKYWANDSNGEIAHINSTLGFFVGTDDPPNVTLLTPANGTNQNEGSITFTYNVTDDLDTNLTCNLYGNFTGPWQSQSLGTGTNGSGGNFTKTIGGGTHLWNVQCTDSGANSAFAAANFTLILNESVPSTVEVNFTLCSAIQRLIFFPTNPLEYLNMNTGQLTKYNQSPLNQSGCNCTFTISAFSGSGIFPITWNVTAPNWTLRMNATAIPANFTLGVGDSMCVNATVDYINATKTLGDVDIQIDGVSVT